jgi:hypothetical protein
MSESIIQKDQGEHGQVLDVARLVEAVRGSQAARILFEFRPSLPRSGECKGDENSQDQASRS